MTLTATQNVSDVSVTERNAFKTCRRRWHLDTILNLEPKGVNQWPLIFGTGIHSALEEYYTVITLAKGGKVARGAAALEAALAALDRWAVEESNRLHGSLSGALMESAGSELNQLHLLGIEMLENYHMFASVTDKYKVLAVEGQILKPTKAFSTKNAPYGEDAMPTRHESGRILVPIVDPVTKEPLPGPVYLSGKIDLVVQDPTPAHKGLWIKDHKTSSGSVSDRGLDFDDQITGYCYILWRLTGEVPRGVLFNYLFKTEVPLPRILKDGSLSTAKDQGCLPHMYKAALKEHGLMKGAKIASEKHAECYEALLARGWDRQFRRFRPTRSVAELESFERRLILEITDMQAVRDNTELAYPHLAAFHCGYCSMAPLCQAMEKGEDYEYLIETMFTQAPDRKA